MTKIHVLLLLTLLFITVYCMKKPSTATCYIKKGITRCHDLLLRKNQPLFIENCTNILKIENSLKEIPPHLFLGLPNLQQLIINYTLADKIYPRSFEGLSNLEQLDLYWNQIAEIPPNVFADCHKLTYLNLGGNNLPQFEGDTLKHLKFLKKLIISKNLLNTIPRFSGLEQLELLDLSGNKIETLTKDSFLQITSLIELNLKGNQIKLIEAGAFNGLSQLTSLNLEKNHLDFIHVGDLLDSVRNLKEIRLKINYFSCGTLKEIIEELIAMKVKVPEGYAEPGPITYHGIFCLLK